jgi:Spy/CpxP family protein refolding chaperone
MWRNEMKTKLGLMSMFFAGLVASFVVSASAQPPDGPRMGRFVERESAGFGGDGIMTLLQDERIRQELDMVEDQNAELQTLRDELTQGMRELFDGMRDLSPEERRERFDEIREEMDQKRKDIEEKVNNMLLPHQQKRLQQLIFQSQSRRGGALGFAANDNILEKLGVTEEQKNQLREKGEQVRKELDEKIAKLRKEAADDLLSVLSAEQRQKYQDLVGDSFDFGDQGDRGFGGGRGGRRDRGGEDGNRENRRDRRPGSDF